MKNLLYDLPKELLIELLEKTYNFDSIPLEEVYKIKKNINLTFDMRIAKEEEKRIKILKTTYTIEDIKIFVNYHKILLENKNGVIFLISLFRYRHQKYCLNINFDQGIGFDYEYREPEELFAKIKELNRIDENLIFKVFEILKLLIEAFMLNLDINDFNQLDIKISKVYIKQSRFLEIFQKSIL